MTSLPSSSRFLPLVRRVSMLAVLAGASFLGACEDKHIGRPCEIGVQMNADPTIATVNPAALECPSRICLLPAQERSLPSPPTGALCTDECSSDDDCSDGESRNKNDPNDKRCLTGFKCRRVIPNLESNPLSCKRVCVCYDFLNPNDKDTKPPSCP